MQQWSRTRWSCIYVTIKWNSGFGHGGPLNFVIPKSAINLENKDFQRDTETSITTECSCFVSCTAFAPGGTILIDDSTAEHQILKNITLFANNSARGLGGGSCIHEARKWRFSCWLWKYHYFRELAVFNNVAKGAPWGTIYIDSSTAESNLTIKQTCFRNNSAGRPGGVIYSVKAPARNLQVHSANFIKLEESCSVYNMASRPWSVIKGDLSGSYCCY